MPKNRVRALTVIAIGAWLVVGGYGVREIVAEDPGDGWEIPYLIFSSALMIGALVTVAAVWIVSRPGARPPLRAIGLGICAVGVLSTFVSWALPLWMTVLATGYAVVAVSAATPWRRPVALLAGAQLLGIVVLVIAISAEVGPRDEYGDHPAAFGVSIVATAVATMLTLYELYRTGAPARSIQRTRTAEVQVGV